MKKILLFLLLSANLSVFAYTSIDVSNGEFLANRGIINKQNDIKSYRLDDTITRAEVIKIALTIKGTANPNAYTCKKYFSDTTANDWVCRAIEIAADAGFISRSNKKFRPQDKITRAEALIILTKARGIYEQVTQSEHPYIFDTDIGWQQELLRGAFGMQLLHLEDYKYTTRVNNSSGPISVATLITVTFEPNRAATRAEVFAFARDILSYTKKNTTETTVKIENNNVVVYRNGEPGEQLTTDGNANTPENCPYPASLNNYSILGKVGEVFVIKHIFGLCETDAGGSQTLAFTGTLVDLERMVKEKFGIVLGNGIGGKISVVGNKIVISGEFDNVGECMDLGCPVNLTPEKIAALGIQIKKQPTNTSPGEFEFVVNENILFH